VFASTDAQLRGIAESLVRIDSELAALDQEEAQIHAALERPWEYAERYAQMQADLETLNAELSCNETAQPAATAHGGAREAEIENAIPTEEQALTIVCESGAPAPRSHGFRTAFSGNTTRQTWWAPYRAEWTIRED
jgi:hypothetical protein